MATLPATCEVWIDGTRYADDVSDDPFALDGLVISWGRENTIDQPDAATCSFTILDPPGGTVRFDQTVRLGSVVAVWSVVNDQRVLVFGGRITDLVAEFDDGAASGSCQVIAADALSDLANRFVGSEPWPAEVLWQRAQRILTQASPTAILGTIPNRPALLQVSRMDVDRQSATSLLTELAVTGSAVLWASIDPATLRPLIYFEDPTLRASLYVFAEGSDLLWRPTPGAADATSELSACDVLQDPVQWKRAVTDMITRATVRYLDQSTTPAPTDRTLTAVNTGAEVTFGARGISVGTILTLAADANLLLTSLLASHQPGPTWRASGLTWDFGATSEPDAAALTLAAELLDITGRQGHGIALTDLPYWTPTAASTLLYIEGGDYRFEDSRWVLALNGNPATGLGSSLNYGQTDRSVRYVDIDPTVKFIDMIGVGPSGGTGPDWAELVGTWEQQTTNWMGLTS